MKNASALELDHLVVAARTLDEGARFIADTLGVEPTMGGTHAPMGTHNRLLGLWGGAYLEVIAVDPQAERGGNGAEAAARPRWFALDDEAMQARLARGPYLAHWAARVPRPKDLGRWQSQYPERIPPVLPMARGDLTWRLTVPEDGAFPSWQGHGDGVLPTLIQWDTAAHPSTRLAETGLGIALMPRLALDDSRRLIALPVSDQQLQRTMALVSREDRALAPVARALREFLEGQLVSQEPRGDESPRFTDLQLRRQDEPAQQSPARPSRACGRPP